MPYFTHLTTVEDIKSHYRKLVMQHHPDKGGNIEEMKKINVQYEEALETCHGQKIGDKEYKYMQKVERELMDKLQELIKLDGLRFALIGYWLWVTGDTKQNKEALKNARLHWHSKRKCWYYKPEGWKTSSRSNKSLTDLANKYGYKEFSSQNKDNAVTKA